VGPTAGLDEDREGKIFCSYRDLNSRSSSAWLVFENVQLYGVKEPIMRYFFFKHHVVRKLFNFLLQKMIGIQENILLYSETVINTVCRSIQVSVQNICELSTYLLSVFSRRVACLLP
jgi:hypothetical protein